MPIDTSFLKDIPEDNSFLKDIPEATPAQPNNKFELTGTPQQDVLKSNGIQQGPATLGFDPSAVGKPTDIKGNPLQPADLGAAKRQDEAVIQNTDPASLAERMGVTAFGRSFTDAALGGFGDNLTALSRSGMQPGEKYNQELQIERNQQQQDKQSNPALSAFGTLLGIAANGYVGGNIADAVGNLAAQGVDRLAASKAAQMAAPTVIKTLETTLTPQAAEAIVGQAGQQFFKGLAKNTAEIGTLGLLGGVDSVGLSNADTFDQAAEAFKQGAKWSAIIGATAKLPSFLLSPTTGVAVSKEAKNAFQYSSQQGDYIANNAKEIGQRVADLPDNINQSVDAVLNQVGKAKSDRIAQLAQQDVQIPVRGNFEPAYSKLANLSKYKSEADAAADVRTILQDHEENLLKRGTEDSARIDLVDSAKQDLQDDLLKGGKLYSYKGTKAYQVASDFEKSLRSSITDVDPKIGAYNDVYYNLKNAKDEVPSVVNFESFAKDPNKPSNLSKEFSQYIDPSNYKPGTIADPDTAFLVNNLQKHVDMQIQPALEDYAVLHKVQGGRLEEAIMNKSTKQLIPTIPGTYSRLGQLNAFTPQWIKSGLSGLATGAQLRAPSALGLSPSAPRALGTIQDTPESIQNSLQNLK